MSAHSSGAVLSLRALNRATLDRQMLLRGADCSVLDAVHHLYGLQAQAPLPPYFALWARLRRFQPDDLAQLILDRQVLRMVMMRGTVHLTTGHDGLALRALTQPIMDGDLRTNTTFAPLLRDIDLKSLATRAREILATRTTTGAELGKLLAETWPDHEPRALAHAARNLLPLVQVPPRAIWGKSGQPTYATAESWLGERPPTQPSVDNMVLRYLAAYGPATVKDAQAWSGLTKLAEVLERLRPQLRPLRDEQGRELFDLPDAPRPDPDVSAPVRFLAPFDNILLSHADRTRIISDEHRKRIISFNGLVKGTILVAGFARGSWEITRKRGTATLSIAPFAKLSKKDITALVGAGARLLAFAESDADTHDVQFSTAST